MAKLSVLIFSRNDIDKALGLIKDVYEIADDIVLVDSSDKAERNRLYANKRRLALGKLRIFYVVALGYPDPLRTYAIGKCRYSWVLLIDTDERLSEGLKSTIKGLIGTAKCSAFAIKRYESREGKPTPSFTWQIHLFNKKNTTFRGIVHEQPIVKGRIDRLESREVYIDHLANQQGAARFEYGLMEKFERMDYAIFNERLLDYSFKLSLPADRNPEHSRLGILTKRVLLSYERLRGKNRDEEISNFDYFAFYFIRSLVFAIKERNLTLMLRLIPNEIRHVRNIKMQRNAPDGQEVFELSKIISKVGVTKFLGLDDGNTIKLLNDKYENKRQGITLLMRLLMDKYRSRRRVQNKERTVLSEN